MSVTSSVSPEEEKEERSPAKRRMEVRDSDGRPSWDDGGRQGEKGRELESGGSFTVKRNLVSMHF